MKLLKQEKKKKRRCIGLKCPKCGCADFRDEIGRPWKTVKTQPIPYAIRRYKTCRYCGKKVRTKEVIDR